MTAAEKIQKLGFRRWYERTLLEGHAFFVTGFLGMILALSSLEAAAKHTGVLSLLVSILVGGTSTLLALYAMRRYLRMISFAGTLSNHATCRQCDTYASFTVLSSNLSDSAATEEPGSVWLKVKCRQCGNVWTLPDHRTSMAV